MKYNIIYRIPKITVKIRSSQGSINGNVMAQLPQPCKYSIKYATETDES